MTTEAIETVVPETYHVEVSARPNEAGAGVLLDLQVIEADGTAAAAPFVIAASVGDAEGRAL
jgi:hypothetical protein